MRNTQIPESGLANSIDQDAELAANLSEEELRFMGRVRASARTSEPAHDRALQAAEEGQIRHEIQRKRPSGAKALHLFSATCGTTEVVP
jgi:hypothetical protein